MGSPGQREKDSLNLKKNSGKCCKKLGIIYQKITSENFMTVSPKEFKMRLVPREVTLNTDFLF